MDKPTWQETCRRADRVMEALKREAAGEPQVDEAILVLIGVVGILQRRGKTREGVLQLAGDAYDEMALPKTGKA